MSEKGVGINHVGIGILAGGEGRRMGAIDKASLRLGGKNFLEHIVDEVAEQGRELLISTGSRNEPLPLPFPQIKDRIKGCGAMGGIASLLRSCESEWLFVIPCDMPLFKRDLIAYVCNLSSAADEAIILRDRRGRAQPACGLYSKAAAGVFDDLLKVGQCRLTKAFDHLRTCFLPMSDSPFDDEVLTNINTTEAYRRLLSRYRE